MTTATDSKTRIAIFIYSLAGGGAERVVSYLLPYLQNKGHEVHLVLMNKSRAYPIPSDTSIHYLEKSKPDEAGWRKFAKLPLLAYHYAKFLKKKKITHSFSLLTRPCYINIMARWFTRHNFRLMISERNYPSEQYGYGDLMGKINTFLVRNLYPKADLVVSNARASIRDLETNFGVSPNKTSVVYNPIDLDKIDGISPKTDFFDPRYFNIISVGRLQTVKNHELLLQALEGVDAKVRLYLLGEGILKRDLVQSAAEKGLNDQVFFLGFDPNPYQYLKAADLFIFGSNHEGFPNVLLEAMACGLPILSTNCPSGPDEIMQLKESKINAIMPTPYGVLVPVNNVDLMTRGVNYMLENPDYLNKCKSACLKRIQDFNKTQILEQYENTLLDV